MSSKKAVSPATSPTVPIINPPIWRIYYLRRLADSCGYVGVTQRPLAVRLAAHDHRARLRPRRGGPGTLAAAIRQAYAEGLSFQAAFQPEVLAETLCPHEARNLERTWIARLGTAAPRGFNIMPGGASLGGPANVAAVTIAHPTRGILRFASLMDAVAATDRERRDQGQPPLRLGTLYARRELGWAIEEALELKAHVDGRRERAAFRWRGRTYRTLEEVARSEGLAIDTVRSKLFRARQAGCDPDHDASQDRRRPGTYWIGGARCGRQPPLVLPHPLDPRAAAVDAASFARLTGLPRATVLNRHRRLVQGQGEAVPSRSTVLVALMERQDRRLVISLPLPGGKTLRDGVRAVIRKVLSNPALNNARAESLGASAIRACLRRIPGWPEDLPPEAVSWAFGFRDEAGPTPVLPMDRLGLGIAPPGSAAAWRHWPPEQLWLWPDPTSPAVRGRMRAVLADALATLPPAEVERVSALADLGEPGAALRLSARLLGRRAEGNQKARDLSASALLLATLEYGDERAALEFALLAHQFADPAIKAEHGEDRYPPPFGRPKALRARMRRQAALALSRVRSNLGSAFLDGGKMGTGDPLADLDACGQPEERLPRVTPAPAHGVVQPPEAP